MPEGHSRRMQRNRVQWWLYQAAVYVYTGGRYRETRGSVITLISNIYTSFTTGPWPPVTRGPPTQLSALVTHRAYHAPLRLVASESTHGGCPRRRNRSGESFPGSEAPSRGARGRERWKWYSPYSRCRYLATSLPPSSSLLLFISAVPALVPLGIPPRGLSPVLRQRPPCRPPAALRIWNFAP